MKLGLKVGLIGAGKFGSNHLRTLHEMGVLTAIAELDDATRAAAENQYGVTGYKNFLEMLDTVDAVVIATPAGTHYSIAKAVIQAGKPVMVEKPLTLDVAEGEELVALAKSRNVTLMVGHLLIYQPAIQWIKQALKDGLIGELRSLHQDRLNLGKARNQENALWSLGVHDVAVALYLTGEHPTGCHFVGQSITTPGIEDDTFVHITFASGIQAHIHSSWMWPEMRRLLTIIGTTGMITFDDRTKQVTHVKKSIDANLNNVDNGSEIIFEGDSQPLRLELEHFLHCVLTGETPKSSGESAIQVLKVMAGQL